MPKKVSKPPKKRYVYNETGSHNKDVKSVVGRRRDFPFRNCTYYGGCLYAEAYNDGSALNCATCASYDPDKFNKKVCLRLIKAKLKPKWADRAEHILKHAESEYAIRKIAQNGAENVPKPHELAIFEGLERGEDEHSDLPEYVARAIGADF